MNAVFQAMQGAKDAILFLVFQPGSPSIVDQAAQLQDANQALFVHGAATDPGAVQNFDTHLFHRTAAQTDTDVVSAAAINDQFGFWEKELLKSGPSAHAIIHDKIVVIDPFSPDCVVITGSHNLGYRASYNNDENLLIIRGNKLLAAAYTVHVMDVYDHYRWRFMLQHKGKAAWNGLVASDTWQDKYFYPGSASARELEFWMQAAHIFPPSSQGSENLKGDWGGATGKPLDLPKFEPIKHSTRTVTPSTGTAPSPQRPPPKKVPIVKPKPTVKPKK